MSGHEGDAVEAVSNGSGDLRVVIGDDETGGDDEETAKQDSDVPGSDGKRSREGPSTTDSDDAEATDSTTVMPGSVTYTPRFAGFILLFGVLVGVGVLTFNPAAIAGASALLIFLLAGLLQTPTHPAEHFTTTYDITPEHPRPAEPVTIEVTVTNTSDGTFPDLRLVDTVPDGLTVIDGSPRTGQPLRPGQSTTITYTVTAQRGTYSFGPVSARTRTLMGSMWVQESLPITSAPELHCAVNADDIPLEERATHYIGGLLGDTGGDGVEFYATREYHRGDPPSKINWRELAKRDELSTITYRQQQAAEITIICDARGWSHVSSGAGTPSAASLSIYAGYQLTTSLINRGHYVGMTVPGLLPANAGENGRGRDGFPYRRFDHGRGAEPQYRAFDFINDVEEAIEAAPDEDRTAPLRDYGTGSFREGRTSTGAFDVSPYKIHINEFVDSLTGWASPMTQFIFITPMLDDGAHGLCMKLNNMGFSVVVVSPDPTKATTETPVISEVSSNSTPAPESSSENSLPGRILSLQRATRLESLRHNGLTVIDWDPNTPLSVCCERQTLPGV
jgi:Uncharacterized conserved protein (some members contain a von Willebrand factor type A (vWA) domain)